MGRWNPVRVPGNDTTGNRKPEFKNAASGGATVRRGTDDHRFRSYDVERGAQGMTFDKESGIVKVWVNLVQNGTYTREQVPKMFNLQEVVAEVLDEQAAEDAA